MLHWTNITFHHREQMWINVEAEKKKGDEKTITHS